MARSSKERIWFNGAVMVIVFLAAFQSLIALWPAVDPSSASTTPPAAEADTATGSAEDTPADPTETPAPATDDTGSTDRVKVSFLFGLVDWSPELNAALLVLVAIAGLLGSLLHTANSFAVHVAKGRFGSSWQWWYIMRPLFGAGLALLVYLLVRGQLLGFNSVEGDLNPYGIAGVSALVGLFSRQAMDKLSEVFDVVFASSDSAPQSAREIAIDRVEPETVTAGLAALLTITGEGFEEGLTATVNDVEATVRVLDATSVELDVPADALEAPGQADIALVNPGGAEATTTIAIS